MPVPARRPNPGPGSGVGQSTAILQTPSSGQVLGQQQDGVMQIIVKINHKALVSLE